MDYEKEYYEIVRRARELHESGNELTKKQMEIVCPQLAESEDERIRKHLIDCLKFSLKGAEEQDAAGCIRQKDIEAYKWGIAYLEKQKEQKPAENNEKELLYVCNKSYKIGYRDGKRDAQKPAEWSEEDEKMIKDCSIAITSSNYFFSYDERCAMDAWLKSLRPQPHWKPSEEQIEEFRKIIMPYERDRGGRIIYSLYDQLKAL